MAQLETALARQLQPVPWIGWRLRVLVVVALLGCIAVFVLARSLAQQTYLDALWRVNAQGQVELVGSGLPELQGLHGRVLLAVGREEQAPIGADSLLLQRSARWIVADAQRERHRVLNEQVSAVMQQGPMVLTFADAQRVRVTPMPRSMLRLGAVFWLMAAFALGLYVVAWATVLSRPSVRNVFYAVIALCQAGNLALIGVESAFELRLPASIDRWDAPLRMTLDLITAAVIVHAATVHPRRLPAAAAISAANWALVAGVITLAGAGWLANLWWWTQALVALLGIAAIGLLTWSYRIERHPSAAVLRRFGVVTVGTWILLTLAIAVAADLPRVQHQIAASGSVIWYVFFASLLLALPFIWRSQQVVREFAMLAAVSTVATSLDLLFAAVFSLGQFASFTLAVFVALGVYAGVRQWVLNRMLGSGVTTAERVFEQLYRTAREAEAHPENLPSLMTRLLRELFEPLEVAVIDGAVGSPLVVSDGSTLIVPLPDLAEADSGTRERSIAVRFAHRGQRLFTPDDARLAARVVEQLKRAVAYDRAFERGRSEERVRLAQDLHDDIGARLLTLMYTAQNPETENYVRHTLQDLKTLTRGLVAPSHRISHAAAEWKADLSQRLAAAQCELGWRVQFDDDGVLSVVQWSALTRVLRELVTNAIAHAQATRIDVTISLLNDRLDLHVSDDGVGRNPQAWSHGLGLGGVRKRVKQLGGEVQWRENPSRGITCAVHVADWSRRP